MKTTKTRKTKSNGAGGMQRIPSPDPIQLLVSDLIGRSLPEQIPELEWNAGYFKRQKYKNNLRDHKEVATLQADVAAETLRKVKAFKSTVFEISTIGIELENLLAERRSEKDLLAMKMQREQIECLQGQEGLRGDILRNNAIEIENDRSTLHLKREQHDFKESLEDGTAMDDVGQE